MVERVVERARGAVGRSSRTYVSRTIAALTSQSFLATAWS